MKLEELRARLREYVKRQKVVCPCCDFTFDSTEVFAHLGRELACAECCAWCFDVFADRYDHEQGTKKRSWYIENMRHKPIEPK